VCWVPFRTGIMAGGILPLKRKERWADREMVEWFLLPYSLQAMVKGCLFLFFFLLRRLSANVERADKQARVVS